MTTNTTTKKSRGPIVAAVVAGGVAVAGIATALTMALGAPAASANMPTPDPSAGTSTGTGTHTGGHHSDVAPSAAMKTLQQQLAQLNYYNGPISGYWNQATTHAIENLQRAADLPQTGTMNTATQQALDYQLAHGDNQMGGNTNTPASPSISKLQTELAQLNYYDGTITGHINTGTVHAIENLQRAAGLPQTGSMNVATTNALDYQLAHGDNQMGN